MIARNPELLRYMRSELRRSRVAMIVLATLGGSLLMALFLYENNGQPDLSGTGYWRDVYGAIFLASSIFFVLWSLLNVSQSVVSERTQRTFDFWRTTRLAPLTLALGKLFGAPLGPWLHFATVLPVLVLTGLLGGVQFTAIVGSYLVVAVFSVALSATALCGSMRAQDARRANIWTLLVVIALLPTISRSVEFIGHSATSAWTALSPALGISMWLQGTIVSVSLFGHSVPSLLVSVVLSLAVIAWCLVAMVRCIKFEPDQISLFSPAQVVGVSATILLFVYAAFRPMLPMMPDSDLAQQSAARWTLMSLIGTGVGAAIACLYFTITSTLLTRDNLRQQLRKRTSSEVALRAVVPWVATGAIGLFAAAIALIGYRQAFAGAAPQWFDLIAMYLSIAAYAVRDGMFLQWMVSQKVKAPVMKGSALLICYYLGCSVVAAVMAGPAHMFQMLRWLAPYVTTPEQAGPGWMIIALLIPPIATAALLAMGVFRSVKRSSQATAALVSA